MTIFEKNCYAYVMKLTETLTWDYEAQYKYMDDIARWNLPEETALEWIDADGMFGILEERHCISTTTVALLHRIKNNFISAFHADKSVWTHDAMKNAVFWNEQRALAKKALESLKKEIDDISQD